MRYSKNREFFLITVEMAVNSIRGNISEILGEEISDDSNFGIYHLSSSRGWVAERNSLVSWIEVSDAYWQVFTTREHLERSNNKIAVWQMHSINKNKKMRDYQSLISKRIYSIIDNTCEHIYDCFFHLPMGKGDIVREVSFPRGKFLPLIKGSPSEGVFKKIRSW
jgi:hypothetical protein